jgi:uncharacterized protein (DUF3084 family)
MKKNFEQVKTKKKDNRFYLTEFSLVETNAELENVRSKLVQLTNDYEQLNAAKKEFETNESNTRRKIDETNRSRQAVLDRTRDEYEKLLRKYTDLDEVYRELVDLREKETCKHRNKIILISFVFQLLQQNRKQFVRNLNVYIMKILN